jgi:hypothetical protein
VTAVVDVGTAVTSVFASLGLSAAGFYWIGKTLAEHQLQRMMEDHKAELSRDLARVEGLVREQVETSLGETAARRQYEYDARRRLYLAIGPLRFQLLLACRDLAGRINMFPVEHYATSLKGYYGRSTAYRILRPIAIADLIQEQVALSDFSLDIEAVECLRFRRTATRIFSGDEIVRGHPDANWNAQVQHVYAERLQQAARILVSAEDKRILLFDEFAKRLDEEGVGAIAPFDRLLEKFSVENKPILWLRLVAWGNACNALIERLGDASIFPRTDFPVRKLIGQTGDRFIDRHLGDYEKRIQSLRLVEL